MTENFNFRKDSKHLIILKYFLNVNIHIVGGEKIVQISVIKIIFICIAEKKIFKILLQVEVAWREADISLEFQEADKKKEINKRKQEILDGNNVTKKLKQNKLKQNSSDQYKSKNSKKTIPSSNNTS